MVMLLAWVLPAAAVICCWTGFITYKCIHVLLMVGCCRGDEGELDTAGHIFSNPCLPNNIQHCHTNGRHKLKVHRAPMPNHPTLDRTSDYIVMKVLSSKGLLGIGER